MNRLEALLAVLSTVKIEDIAAVPLQEQPLLVNHLEELQDQLISILKDQLPNRENQIH